MVQFLTALRHSAWAALTVSRNGWPRKVISYGGGVGDELLCTTVARELRKRNSGKIWVVTKYQELFEGNEDAVPVPISDWRIGALGRVLGADIRPLWYTYYQPECDRDPEPPKHFAAMMCQKAGVVGEVSVRPYLYLRREEREQGRVIKNQIAVQSSSLSAETPLGNKEWFPERFQAVLDMYSRNFNFVQIGSATDPKLDNVIDLRGKTTLRQAAAILSASSMFMGLAGGLMHLARSVGCPAVIVYGGRERSEISGYICNINIATLPPCSPCWRRNRCDYDRLCMKSIDTNLVANGVGQMLDRRRDDLLVEVVNVGVEKN